MDKKKAFSACNINLDKDNYKKGRTICKKCYNEKKRKHKNNTLIPNQQHTSSEKNVLLTLLTKN